MKECHYKKIIVIGYGRVTGEVIEKIRLCQKDYGYEMRYVEHEVHDFNKALKCCEENNISHQTIEDKDELTKWFLANDDKTLIISASNNFLFPEDVVKKENLTIINFHNALLPDLPGRNAPSWAIYNGKTETGITWHYVNPDIDAGEVIIQKKCQIGEDEKAYELADRLMHLASEAFEECFDEVLSDKAPKVKQDVPKNRHIYRSSELPGGGSFKEGDSPELIYRILRSMDYGKSDVFPPVMMQLYEEKVRVVRYKIIDKSKLEAKDNVINIQMDGDRYLQIKYSPDK